MELSDYVRILKQRGWLIILLAVLTAGTAAVFSRMQTPVYRASVRMAIYSRPDFGANQTAGRLKLLFAEKIKSSDVATDVINALELETDSGTLLSKFKAEPDNTTEIILLQFENENCDLAKDIVRTWGDQLIQWRNQQNAPLRQEDRVTADFLGDPQCGMAGADWKINGVAGGVFGVLLGTMLALLLEWLASSRVRRAEDIERHLQLSVIGKIPR